MKQNLAYSLSTAIWSAVVLLIAFSGSLWAEDKTPTASEQVGNQIGPQTEKRFPPLVLPEGFKATLFACDPLVEYPSVIALGPKPHSLFVAHDYMTGLGVEIVRRDEIRLVQDTDHDGYADTSTLYAGGFNSIQGLAYHAGSVYVMHAPSLTSLQDTDGDGVADRRRDLFSGLGLPPEENSNRLHCANGVVVGHDGWLYLAIGDRGCDVKRAEGDRLIFRQGGILRCRADGSDLHILAGGMRNIYDIALDEELNVFVRDNENDGGDYMIRVCHSFHGADHGYPYWYYERPEQGMLPLADLGRGSSAGATSYLETAFGKEYRESLFFCEWGRAVVRYHKKRSGSSFAPMQETDFVAGAPTDPYGFKPTDLVVDYDGSLLVSDWGDGQRPKRGRARIYRITQTGSQIKPNKQIFNTPQSDIQTLISQLNSASYHLRVASGNEIQRRGHKGVTKLKQALQQGKLNDVGRMHAIWILVGTLGKASLEDLFHIAETDLEPRVQAQAVRALADLTDPILSQHKLSAKREDSQIGARLANLVKNNSDSRLTLEVMIALGRLRWPDSPQWIQNHFSNIKLDPALEHAAMQMLRRSNQWPAVLQLLDDPKQKNSASVSLHDIATRAVFNQPIASVVDGLIDRLKTEPNALRRGNYARALARVYKKPAPWVYWGFRPAPRPANITEWERTESIQQALNRALADPNTDVRTVALKQMRREKVPVQLASLSKWLRKEKDAQKVATLLEAFNDYLPTQVRELLELVVRDESQTDSNRLLAVAAFMQNLDLAEETRLLQMAQAIDQGPVLAAIVRDFATRGQLHCNKFLLRKLKSVDGEVRSAAIYSLAARKNRDAVASVAPLLNDSDVRVRRAAASAAGILQVAATVKQLRELAASNDRELCRASLVSLSQLGDSGAVAAAISALKYRETQLAALSYLERFGDARKIEPVTKLAMSNRSSDVLTAAMRTLSQWKLNQQKRPPASQPIERAIAEIQASAGTLLQMSVLGPISSQEAFRQLQQIKDFRQSAGLLFSSTKGWQNHIASSSGASFRLQPPANSPKTSGTSWLAVTEIYVEKPSDIEFLGSCNGPCQIWLNGQKVFHREKATRYQPNSDRFDASLVKGMNRLMMVIDQTTQETRFHLRFRSKSSRAEDERLIQLALRGKGNAARGRELFLNAEKSQCVKCHRLGDQTTGLIGPDLTGIGSRFSRIHLIESILEPSRTIAPSYATLMVALNDGQVLVGVKISEDESTLILGDNQGKTHTILRSRIDQQKVQLQSTMPEDLEKKLSDREFLDLLSYLLSEKNN